MLTITDIPQRTSCTVDWFEHRRSIFLHERFRYIH